MDPRSRDDSDFQTGPARNSAPPKPKPWEEMTAKEQRADRRRRRTDHKASAAAKEAVARAATRAGLGQSQVAELAQCARDCALVAVPDGKSWPVERITADPNGFVKAHAFDRKRAPTVVAAGGWETLNGQVNGVVEVRVRANGPRGQVVRRSVSAGADGSYLMPLEGISTGQVQIEYVMATGGIYQDWIHYQPRSARVPSPPASNRPVPDAPATGPAGPFIRDMHAASTWEEARSAYRAGARKLNHEIAATDADKLALSNAYAVRCVAFGKATAAQQAAVVALQKAAARRS